MNFHYTHISKKTIKYIDKVLQSGFINEGLYVKKFENKLSNKLKLINPVAVNSCTSALHLALSILDINNNDEVILSPQTFIATGLVILMQKAKPVFVDIQKETGNIDPSSIKHSITKKTKAIMVVHWGGYPSDLDEINEIGKEYNIPIIEDAAHALGSVYKGKMIGNISRFTAFSFQSIKHLTTGDGGALCCLNNVDYLLAKKLRWFGIDRINSKPSYLGERIYNIDKLGFKYHMNNIDAAIGLSNIIDINKIIKRHIEISKMYNNGLSNIKGLNLMHYKNDRQSSYWLYPILVENRKDFIFKLKSYKIPTSVVHQRIDRNSIFGTLTKNLINQEYFDEHQICLPIHYGLSDKDIKKIIKIINDGW